MSTKRLFLMLAVLCGCGGENPLNEEFTRLAQERPSYTAIEAEAAYDSTDQFLRELAEEEDIPEGLWEKTLELRKRRAVQFARATTLEENFPKFVKVYRVLKSNEIDPARAALTDSVLRKYWGFMDPTSDSIPKGWR